MRDTLALDFKSVRSTDADGRLHVESCNLSKACVSPYLGREIPNHLALHLDPNTIYKLYRDPDELARAADSFNNLQLTLNHHIVGADDPKMERTVGTVGSDVRFESPYLIGSIAVWTASAIALVKSRAMRQLSCAYRYRADMTPGVSPDGFAFDGIMRDIIGNHVALVEEGRAGPDVTVSDSLPTELRKMRFPKLNALVASLMPAATEAQLIALDAAMVEEAEDSELTDAEKAVALKEAKDAKGVDATLTEDEMAQACKAAKDKKRAADAGAGGIRMGQTGKALIVDTNALIAAALKSGNYISKDDAAAMAVDAASKATIAAIAAGNALHVAREKVKPLVGVVALDSAQAVYDFALTQRKVSHEGITDVNALGALVDAEVRALDAAKPKPKFAGAADTALAATVAGALPCLARFGHAA